MHILFIDLGNFVANTTSNLVWFVIFSYRSYREECHDFHESKRPLTENDRTILWLPRLGVRRTVSEIVAQIGVSRRIAKERIETMRRRGVLRGFTLEMSDSIKIPVIEHRNFNRRQQDL